MDRAATIAARTVGAQLTAARERRELDRAEAARGAGVPLRFASMLEEGSYPLIADPAYLVPYLRRYATFLGLSAEELVLVFHGENEAADRAAAVALLSTVEEAREGRQRLRRFVAVAVAATAFLGAGFFAHSRGVTVGGIVARIPIRGVTDAVASWTSQALTPLVEKRPSTPPVEAPSRVASAERPASMEEASPPSIDAPEGAPLEVEGGPEIAEPTTRPTVAPRVALVAPTEIPRPVPTAKPMAEPAARVAARAAPAEPRPTAAPAPAPRHRLELTATARQVWVWVSVDGGRRRAVELRRGGSIEFEAKRDIVVSLDDAGGVEARFDGRRLEPLGAPGQAKRNLRFP